MIPTSATLLVKIGMALMIATEKADNAIMVRMLMNNTPPSMNNENMILKFKLFFFFKGRADLITVAMSYPGQNLYFVDLMCKFQLND